MPKSILVIHIVWASSEGAPATWGECAEGEEGGVKDGDELDCSSSGAERICGVDAEGGRSS